MSTQTTNNDLLKVSDLSLIAQIKNLLRVLGTRELDMGLVENSSMALWRDNHDAPHETTVLAVGVDDKNDLYLPPLR